jgi:hypothetical protein
LYGVVYGYRLSFDTIAWQRGPPHPESGSFFTVSRRGLLTVVVNPIKR